jgi:hypothetical protein
LDITKLAKKKPGLGASDFVGANFRHFVKNILSRDYSAANSVPFQIMGRKTIKIFAKIWRNCLEHERALKNFLCSCFQYRWPLEQNHKIWAILLMKHPLYMF